MRHAEEVGLLAANLKISKTISKVSLLIFNKYLDYVNFL